MSELWTPGAPEPHEPQPSAAIGPLDPGPSGAPDEDMTVSEEEIAGILRIRDEMRATPAADVVANHAVGIYQLALLQLGADGIPAEIAPPVEPNFPEARLAIDALAALVEGLGGQLGPHTDILHQALAQVQLLYVEASQAYGMPTEDDA